MAPSISRRYTSGRIALGKKKKERFQQYLKVAVVLLSVICASLLVVVVSLLLKNCTNTTKEMGNSSKDQSEQVCLTADCVVVSSLYLANMDLDTDPCDDFFKFTCGNFVKNNVLYGSTDLIRDLGLNKIPLSIDKQLIKLLGRPGNTLHGNYSDVVRKLKDVFFSCINSSGSDQNDASTLQQYIDNVGGWSLSGEQRGNNNDVEKVAAITHRNGNDGLFKTWVVANPFKDLTYELRLQSPRRSLSSSLEFITSVVALLQTDPTSSSAEQRMKEITDIERSISELTPSEEYRKDPLRTMKTQNVAYIRNIFGKQFDFDRYLHLLLSPSVHTPSKILIESIDFLKGISELLQNYTRVAVADYIIWTSVKSRLPYLSKPFSTLNEKYAGGGFSKADSCLELVKTYFSQVLGAIYVQSYHDKALDPELSEMVSQLKESFTKVIQHAKWMNEDTRKKTLEKLNSMDRIVAYMEENADGAKLDHLYRYHGPVNDKDIFQNVNNIMWGTYARQLSLLGKKEGIVDAVSEQQAPYDTSATYASHQNTIIVWAGLLQYAFFDKRFPTVLKYGGLGFVIGHEIIHGFDNDGKNYDITGRYTQWWDNETIENFDGKAKCFVHQYSQYKAVSNSSKKYRTYVDGNRTLGENIADNGAVKIAYAAYKNWFKIHGPEARLPGMNLTDDQLFFIGMATPLCTVEAPLLSLYNIKYDVHTQARYRVLGSLRNFEKFAQVYNCPVGSYMNPEERCSVW